MHAHWWLWRNCLQREMVGGYLLKLLCSSFLLVQSLLRGIQLLLESVDVLSLLRLLPGILNFWAAPARETLQKAINCNVVGCF